MADVVTTYLKLDLLKLAIHNIQPASYLLMIEHQVQCVGFGIGCPLDNCIPASGDRDMTTFGTTFLIQSGLPQTIIGPYP